MAVEIQKSLQFEHGRRGVRFDAYADTPEQSAAIEMQTYIERFIGRRSRLYRSNMDLDQLEEKDLFVIRVLDRIMTYEVDQVLIVLPEEMDSLAIDPNADLCTLVTCTPYGINSHRLLVRGERVQMDQKTIKKQVASVSEESVKMPTELILAIAAVAVLLMIALIVLLKREKKEEPQNSTEEHDSPEKKE